MINGKEGFVRTEYNERANKSYVFFREQEIKEIKRLYAQTKKVEFSNTDHWIVVGGKTFNGFTREHFEKIVGIKEAK